MYPVDTASRQVRGEAAFLHARSQKDVASHLPREGPIKQTWHRWLSGKQTGWWFGQCYLAFIPFWRGKKNTNQPTRTKGNITDIIGSLHVWKNPRKLTPDGWKFTKNSQRSHEIVDRGEGPEPWNSFRLGQRFHPHQRLEGSWHTIMCTWRHFSVEIVVDI